MMTQQRTTRDQRLAALLKLSKQVEKAGRALEAACNTSGKVYPEEDDNVDFLLTGAKAGTEQAQGQILREMKRLMEES